MDKEEVSIRVYGSSAPQQLLFFGDAECRLPEQLNGSYCQDKTYYLHSLAHVATVDTHFQDEFWPITGGT